MRDKTDNVSCCPSNNTYIHSQETELAQQETPPSKALGEVDERTEPHGRPQQKMAFGGYDCKFVEPPPNAIQTECPICHFVLRDPYLINCCGNNFCHSCIRRIQDEHKHCPTCREDNFKVFSNMKLIEEMAQTLV